MEREKRDIGRHPIVSPSANDPVSRGHMESMVRCLDSILALAGLEDFPKTQSLPSKLFEHFSDALKSYDQYIEHVLSADKWEVQCSKGCSRCCEHELARGISVLEALNIYRWVRPWAQIESIYENCGENSVAFQKLLAEELRTKPGRLTPDDARVTTAHIKYNRLKRPCPFLDQDQGACAIYAVRPMVCRYFFSLSPPEWCDPDHESYLDRDARGIDPHQEVKTRMAVIDAKLGVKALNFLAGAFVLIAGDFMQGRPLTETDD